MFGKIQKAENERNIVNEAFKKARMENAKRQEARRLEDEHLKAMNPMRHKKQFIENVGPVYVYEENEKEVDEWTTVGRKVRKVKSKVNFKETLEQQNAVAEMNDYEEFSTWD